MLAAISALIGPVSAILDKVIPDKDLREKLSHEIATMAERHSQEQVMAQIEVNKAEAAHKSLFVAGWRPAIGWICGFALLYSTIISPVIGIWVEVPEIDTSLLTSTMLGMLGLGAMRTFEKTKGVSREK
ncbi:holin family protein [Flavobacteriaceae bacterium]|jgi:roadblock/LC7 domain-containing protein|nr:holin family protein [Flavobacteriaceae bacterium]